MNFSASKGRNKKYVRSPLAQFFYRRYKIVLPIFIIFLFFFYWYINKHGYKWTKYFEACSHATNPTINITKEFYAEHIEQKLREDPNQPLYKMDFFYYDSQDEWDEFIKSYVGPSCMRDDLKIFESGMGCGAFLDSLQRQFKNVEIAGSDFTSKMIQVARKRLKGDFWVADSTNLLGVPSDTYDLTLSFSVFNYLQNEYYVFQALKEMARVTKPGGCLYIGNINDAAKKEYAPCFTSSLFIAKQFWIEIAKVLGLENVRIIDEYDLKHKNLDWKGQISFDARARFRYSVYMDKPK